jgi:aminopeptidase N
MLRRKLGDDPFWSGLQDVYRTHLFQKVSWEDFRVAFENQTPGASSGHLQSFFDQWLRQAGAPQLSTKNIRRQKMTDNAWMVSRQIGQKKPVFNRHSIPYGLLPLGWPKTLSLASLQSERLRN